MRVNLAAQVLSHSVAAGISFLVTCKELPEESLIILKYNLYKSRNKYCFISDVHSTVQYIFNMTLLSQVARSIWGVIGGGARRVR